MSYALYMLHGAQNGACLYPKGCVAHLLLCIVCMFNKLFFRPRVPLLGVNHDCLNAVNHCGWPAQGNRDPGREPVNVEGATRQLSLHCGACRDGPPLSDTQCLVPPADGQGHVCAEGKCRYSISQLGMFLLSLELRRHAALRACSPARFNVSFQQSGSGYWLHISTAITSASSDTSSHEGYGALPV